MAPDRMRCTRWFEPEISRPTTGSITATANIDTSSGPPLARLVAMDVSSDRYLFERATGVDWFAIVRLTWSGRAPSTADVPETVLLRSWDAAVA